MDAGSRDIHWHCSGNSSSRWCLGEGLAHFSCKDEYLGFSGCHSGIFPHSQLQRGGSHWKHMDKGS